VLNPTLHLWNQAVNAYSVATSLAAATFGVALRTVLEEVNEPMISIDSPTTPQPTPQPVEESTQDGEPEFNVANAVDDLRQFVAKADALAHAAEDLFERVLWGERDDEEDRRRMERLAHLVGATVEAVETAMETGDEIAAQLAKHQRGA
jgi:hypothetical protein